MGLQLKGIRSVTAAVGSCVAVGCSEIFSGNEVANFKFADMKWHVRSLPLNG